MGDKSQKRAKLGDVRAVFGVYRGVGGFMVGVYYFWRGEINNLW